MYSAAYITILDKTVYVSFQSRNFTPIKNKFVEVFPQAIFQAKPAFLLRHSYFTQHHGAWQLPIATLDDVKEFCNKHFFNVHVEHIEGLTEPAQLHLNL